MSDFKRFGPLKKLVIMSYKNIQSIFIIVFNINIVLIFFKLITGNLLKVSKRMEMVKPQYHKSEKL